MYKVLTVVGTRPELIKMSAIISTISKYCKHILVHTGQNYDPNLSSVFFDDLSIKQPDYYLAVANPEITLAESLANIIKSCDKVFEEVKPDAIMVYGDTNSCLCVIAAKRRKIPVFHFEAGNRCFDVRVPEEINRKIVDHLSDINLTLTEHARRYLLREGIPGQRIFTLGSHLDEVLYVHRKKIQNSDILLKLQIQEGAYFVVSLHREENVDCPERLEKIMKCILNVSQEFGVKSFVSLHPRTKRRLHMLSYDFIGDPTFVFVDPLAFSDYIRLQISCKCLLSDSGTVAEEARILGIAALTFRFSHERPEGIESGAFSLASTDESLLCSQIRLAIDSARGSIQYNTDSLDLSSRASKIVIGHVDHIKNEIWRVGQAKSEYDT